MSSFSKNKNLEPFLLGLLLAVINDVRFIFGPEFHYDSLLID